MNSLLSLLGIEAWKPVLTALVLPPVPWLVLSLIGARTILWRRGVGWLLVLLSAAGLWFSSTTVFGEWFTRFALTPPPPLSAEAISELRKFATAQKEPVAIVVLGGGRESRAPEYGLSNLSPTSLERLRYALWLSRETGAPVAFSGGVGYEGDEGPAEAQVASRIAEREFLRPLRWIEDQSRDTRENARRSVALLKPAGVKRLIVVTHGWHMRRSLRNFEEAAHGEMRIVPGPMGLAPTIERPVLRWLPSYQGYTLTRQALKEGLGLLLGV
jgi:uncharacterized SAM-binding protein YcdF (DUF218 family)